MSKHAKKHYPETALHYSRIHGALVGILESETSDCVYRDDELAEILRDSGIYATKTTVYTVRREHGIPSPYGRKMAAFEREAASRKPKARRVKR